MYMYLRKHGKQQCDEDQFTDKQILYGDEVTKQTGVWTLLDGQDDRFYKHTGDITTWEHNKSSLTNPLMRITCTMIFIY